MKYLKTYESFYTKIKKSLGLNRTLLDWYNERSISDFSDSPWNDSVGSWRIEDLSCTNQKITSLKGIELFTNLKTLKISNNKLKSLEGIENCENLKTIDCSYNQLESLKGIENLKNLKILII